MSVAFGRTLLQAFMCVTAYLVAWKSEVFFFKEFFVIIETQYSGIYAASSADDQSSANAYKGHVEQSLQKISSGSSGYKLLNAIGSVSEAKLRKITIQEISAQESPSTQVVLSRAQVEKYKPDNFRRNKEIARDLASRGNGCNAIINWSPATSIELSGQGSPIRLGDAADESFVVLAHELVHARHFLAGTSKAYSGGDRYDERSEAGKEELRAVGLGKYSKQPSENSIRAEHGLPLRNKYKPRGA